MELALFFDHAGFLVWIFLVWIALHDLKNKQLKKFPRYIILAIGIIGILLDGILLLGLYLSLDFVKYAWLFDHLGIPVFLFLIWLSVNDLHNKKIPVKWSRWMLFIVSIWGLLADWFILWQFYFNR